MSTQVSIPITVMPAIDGKLVDAQIEGYVFSRPDSSDPYAVALSVDGQPSELFTGSQIYDARKAVHTDPAELIRFGLLQALFIEANKARNKMDLDYAYRRALPANQDDARGDYRRMIDAAE